MAPAKTSSAAMLGLGAAGWLSSGSLFVSPTPPRAAELSRYAPQATAAPAAGASQGFAPGVRCSILGVAAVTVAAGARRVARRATQDELKKQVGYKAVDDYVKSGTVIGLGTGSTAAFAVERVGQLLKSGELKDIIAIPTSIRTKEQAESLGIPLATLDTHSDLDVAIDGADEVDPNLNLVKGGGGALFREKIVEMCAKKFIVIVDESKMCGGLGPGFPIPVEIVPFCHEHTMREIAKLPALAGCKPVLRLGDVANNKPDGDKPAVTDNSNYIVDLVFETPIKDAVAAGEQLKNTVGVVDHGLFTGMTTACIIAGSDGISVKEA
uniref:ribose-5-phosphate isomerase n=1 Tax=Kryptoperidinium triquetrum TaxID=66468 RepID=Q5ENN9_KRYTR|nr:chloroplast ribose-5-phosphate isomerase [Heterocapsa triquetra]